MRRGTAGTEQEVRRAIETLSRADLLRLKHFAVWRLGPLGRAASGNTWEDLLHEAIRRTLSGAANNGHGRLWYKKVDFVTHLKGVISSISDHMKRDFDQQEARFESEIEIRRDEEGDFATILDSVPFNEPCLERCLITTDLLNEIKRRHPADFTVSYVIDCFCKELTHSEIMQSTQLSKSEYQQALKRLRRYLRGVGMAPPGVWGGRSKRDRSPFR